MTGQDFQDKLDALVVDLQTVGKGQTVQLTFRDDDNTPLILPLSSTAGGVVNATELAAVQAFIDTLKPIATSFETEREPVLTASEALRDALVPHTTAMETASAARASVNAALLADTTYQAAKTAASAAKADVDYVNALSSYKDFNVSENFQELSSARGKYVGV